jgi:hypothetical protein
VNGLYSIHGETRLAVFSPTAASIAADSMVARRRKECYEKRINMEEIWL